MVTHDNETEDLKMTTETIANYFLWTLNEWCDEGSILSRNQLALDEFQTLEI